MVRNGCVVTRGDPVTLRLQLIAAADVVLRTASILEFDKVHKNCWL